MKVFHCGNCQRLVFFENTHCVNCGRTLAYLPDLGVVAALEPAGANLWRALIRSASRRRYRLCDNYSKQNVCNWGVRDDDPQPLCLSCRLTRVIPDLALPGNREAWFKLEAAKRRVLYTLLQLHCPVQGKTENSEQGLAYEFRSDGDVDHPVMTGHAHGVITVNIAEADDAERERRRLALHEPYRTLLGHFRHEVGHYFWERLIQGSARLEQFRSLFGDERAPYAAALQHHYQEGPPSDWQQHFVSAYAAAHPWEDWAESWAHYLHMSDMLETAAACGVSLRPARRDEPAMTRARSGTAEPFERLIASWFPLTYLLNKLSRSMGLADGYPFVLSTPAIEKLRFIHEIIVAPQ